MVEVFTAISKDSVIDKLIPNWISFVVQLLAFLVLVAIVIIFAYKPVKKIIKKRQNHIEENIKQAELAKQRAESNILKSEQTLTASQKQANEIILEAKQLAEIEKQKSLEQTNEEIKRLKNEASLDIEQSKKDAEEEIRKEMVNLALDASSEILKRNVSSKDNELLAEEFIRSVKDR